MKSQNIDHQQHPWRKLHLLHILLKLSLLSSLLLFLTLLALYNLPLFLKHTYEYSHSTPLSASLSVSLSLPNFTNHISPHEHPRITFPTITDNSQVHEDVEVLPLPISNLSMEKPSLHPPLHFNLTYDNNNSNKKKNNSFIHEDQRVPSSSHESSLMRSKVADGNCDISKGKWIRDREGPYYTNSSCFMIQEHQNCMKYGRPDTDFLRWRWKPEKCELPRFDPRRFLELARNKNMAFIGDSLARNQMQSLMCLLSRVENPLDISDNSDKNFVRMYFSTYNFTIFKFWSPFLVRAEEVPRSDKRFSSAGWKLYIDEVDRRWASRVREFDYTIISGGNWFTRPSMYYRRRRLIGCQYCATSSRKLKPMSMHYPHRTAFRTAFEAITASKQYRGVTFLRTVSPSHFENGAWDRGGDCRRMKPYRKGEAKPEDSEMGLYMDQLKELRRAKREGKSRGLNFRVLDTTGAMLLRPDGHPSKYGHRQEEKLVMYNDCVHWCLPGPVDTWNEFLLHELELLF